MGVDAVKAQAVLANAIMDPEVQRQFNIAKGSIPAVKGVSTEGFDACSIQGMKDLEAAGAKGRALPTVAFTHATSAAVVGAITDVVTRHFNSDMSSADAAAEMRKITAQ